MLQSTDSPFRLSLVFTVIFALMAMLLLNYALVSTAAQSVRTKRTQARLIRESSKIKKSPMVQPIASGVKETVPTPKGNQAI
jgi:hypothetical protein